MDLTDFTYVTSSDIMALLEAEGCTLDELSLATGISRPSLIAAHKGRNMASDLLEKLYSFAYERNYRLNRVKEDILKESSSQKILFHGSRYGLDNVSIDSRGHNCDFGNGFYLCEEYQHALAFVCDSSNSSVYSFSCSMENLDTVSFTVSLEWMLAVCSYRGTLKEWMGSEKIRKIAEKVENADVVIAPIADNRMFHIMNSFACGYYNADETLQSLSSSEPGMQYIFRTEKAISALTPIERYYISEREKQDCITSLSERSSGMTDDLRRARRRFRDGLYIEEILK